MESWGGQIFATAIVESRFKMTEEFAEPGQPSAESGPSQDPQVFPHSVIGRERPVERVALVSVSIRAQQLGVFSSTP